MAGPVLERADRPAPQAGLAPPVEQLRRRMREARASIDPARRFELSAAIGRRLAELPTLAPGRAQAIGFYFSTGAEVQTGELIRRAVEEEGRRAFLPFVLSDRLEMAEWRPSDPVVDGPHVGMQPRFSRPSPLEALDAVVLTGLAGGM